MFETTKQYITLYKCGIIVYPSSCKSLWAPNHTQSINTAINHCTSSALKSVASVSFSKSKISLAAMWRSHMSNSPNATSKSRSKLKAIGNENRETKCSLTWSLPSCSKAFTHQVCQRPELPLEWKLVKKSALLPYYHHMWEHASIVSIRSGPNIMYSMYSQQNHVDFPSQKGTPNAPRWSDHQVSSDPMMDVSKPIALSQRDTLDVTYGWHGWWATWIAMDPFKIQWISRV